MPTSLSDWRALTRPAVGVVRCRVLACKSGGEEGPGDGGVDVAGFECVLGRDRPGRRRASIAEMPCALEIGTLVLHVTLGAICRGPARGVRVSSHARVSGSSGRFVLCHCLRVLCVAGATAKACIRDVQGMR